MARKNHSSGRRIRVTREVYALAALAAYRAGESDPDGLYLPNRVASSRRVSRRMLKALKAQAA